MMKIIAMMIPMKLLTWVTCHHNHWFILMNGLDVQHINFNLLFMMDTKNLTTIDEYKQHSASANPLVNSIANLVTSNMY